MADNYSNGSGMKFPPQINKSTGRFMVSNGLTNIKESIYIILMTQKTERWLRPDFGSNLLSYAFIENNETIMNMLSLELTNTIIEQEQRVSDVSVTFEPGENSEYLIVNVDYYVKSQKENGKVTFPFYLNERIGEVHV